MGNAEYMGTLFSQDTGCDNNVIEKDVI